MTTSARGGSACIAGVSRDRGHGISLLEGGATRSQTRRDTNFAIPGYSISVIIPRRRGKSKIFLSVVNPVVKAAFMPFSAIGENPAIAGVTRLCGVSPCPVPDTTTALPNLCLNLREALLRPLWRFLSLQQVLFGTFLPCLLQPPLSAFGICVGLNSVY